jgi:hypothetical protein
MIPYNVCENKWVSKTKKTIKNNYREYQPLYEIIFGVSLMIVCILGILTALSSFL